MNREIEGLTRYGYTAQTFALAEALLCSLERRDQIRMLLAHGGKPQDYSGQRFDQTQTLAQVFADAIREGK